MQVAGTALDFYAGHYVPWLSHAGEARRVIAPGVVIYTDRARYDELVREGFMPREVIRSPDYRVQVPGVRFLDPRTRDSVLEDRFLLLY